MHKTRLLMLLPVLALTVLSLFTAIPVSQAAVPSDYCWQFSNENCVYYNYNEATGCCKGIKTTRDPWSVRTSASEARLAISLL